MSQCLATPTNDVESHTEGSDTESATQSVDKDALPHTSEVRESATHSDSETNFEVHTPSAEMDPIISTLKQLEKSMVKIWCFCI